MMTILILYEDTYTGPRRRYGARVCPFVYSHQPNGFIVCYDKQPGNGSRTRTRQ